VPTVAEREEMRTDSHRNGFCQMVERFTHLTQRNIEFFPKVIALLPRSRVGILGKSGTEFDHLFELRKIELAQHTTTGFDGE
jgi:hypothetical protein